MASLKRARCSSGAACTVRFWVLFGALLFAGFLLFDPVTWQEYSGAIVFRLAPQDLLRLSSESPPSRSSETPLPPSRLPSPVSISGPKPINDFPAANEAGLYGASEESPTDSGYLQREERNETSAAETAAGERGGSLLTNALPNACWGSVGKVTVRTAAAASPSAANDSEQVLKKGSSRSYGKLSSLGRVELDLQQARTAMRKVVLSQIASAKSNHALSDGDPAGDVYRNADVFRRSYREMERRFKVYVYEESEKPLAHTGPCKEIYAVEGRFIEALQDDNPFLTSDPEKAHAFFLPISVVQMVSYLYTPNSPDRSALQRFVKDYVRAVSRRHPYWARSEGADHFMLSCHDWGPYASSADHNLFSTAIRVLCNANVSEGFIASKDASLPEINLLGGHILGGLGGLPADNRTCLAFFAGGDHGPVRPALYQNWEGKSENGSGINVFHQVPEGGKSYHEYMKSSKFCICPGGFEVNSPRIVEAIYNECVPVVIADGFVLPFSDVLDWKMFSVRVLEKDIPNLKTILEAIPASTYVKMQANVRRVQHHFVLNQPPTKFDAFHMILHSVWLRRLNVQILAS